MGHAMGGVMYGGHAMGGVMCVKGHHMGGVMCSWVITCVASCVRGSLHGWGHVFVGHYMGGIMCSWVVTWVGSCMGSPI